LVSKEVKKIETFNIIKEIKNALDKNRDIPDGLRLELIEKAIRVEMPETDRRKEHDCICNFCKNHICILNSEATRCLHSKCENNIFKYIGVNKK